MYLTGSHKRIAMMAFLGFISSAAHGSIPKVKVLIGKSLKDVLVQGTDMQQSVPSKNLSRSFQGRQTINFNCRVGLATKLPNKPLLIASLTSPTGLIGWEEKRFKGELQLIAGPGARETGCDLVNLVPMDTYISTLLAKEMRADWPIEALKAQAVVARSYALAKMKPEGEVWDLESSEKDQVSGHYYDTTQRTDQATKETEGEILTDDLQRPVAGFFHSKCGGHTLRPDQVWSGSVDGYEGVECPFCHTHGRKAWAPVVSKDKFSAWLGKSLQRYRQENPRLVSDALTFVHDVPDSSEIRFYEGNKLHVVKKSWLRNIIGREQFPSHRFRILDKGATVQIQGEGYGHGVGMCQFGALELAKRGYGYRAILQHYFPRLNVRKMW